MSKNKKKLKKVKPKQSLGMNISDIKMNLAVKEITYNTFSTVLVLPMIVLMEEYGYGNKRLSKFIDKVLIKYKKVKNGSITYDELNELFKDKIGKDIKTIINEYDNNYSNSFNRGNENE